MREQCVLELCRLKGKVTADALEQSAVSRELGLLVAFKLEQRQLGNPRQSPEDAVDLFGGKPEHVDRFLEILHRDLTPRRIVTTLVELIETVEDVRLVQRARLEVKVPGVMGLWLVNIYQTRVWGTAGSSYLCPEGNDDKK